MADTDLKTTDIDDLSDEDFAKLDPAEVERLMTEDDSQDSESEENSEELEVQEENTELEENSEEELEDTSEIEEEVSKEETPNQNPMAKEESSEQEEDPEPKKEEEKEKVQEKEEDKKKKPVKEETITLTPEQETAVNAWSLISAPFKADGREMQVRNPEDAIRLMQMGANYSRRMEEIKPIRAMDQMLRAQGLNEPSKLNFLIDLHKGDKEAIRKLLETHKIDPLDVDTSTPSNYKGKNYALDDETLNFQDAVNNTLRAPGGRELLQDIHSNWDETSKEALKKQPAIFQTILDEKEKGNYDKIKGELDYQRSIGYLTNVPFLQAYHAVSDAMKKAGAFKEPEQTQSMAPVTRTPVDTGTRKAVQPKTEQPNPKLSSTTQPRTAGSSSQQEKQIDYSAMSDDEFLKLGSPG